MGGVGLGVRDVHQQLRGGMQSTVGAYLGYTLWLFGVNVVLAFANLQIYYPVSKNYIKVACVYCKSN